MDVFIEKIVAKKKTMTDYLIIAAVIIGGITALALTPMIPYISQFGSILALAIIYFAYVLVKRRSMEFEYAVTNGELDIDCIIARNRRKRIFSASAKEFEILAKVKSEKYASEYKLITKKIFAGTFQEADDLYFAVLNYKGERTILYFNPSDKMLESFRFANPRNVFISVG